MRLPAVVPSFGTMSVSAITILMRSIGTFSSSAAANASSVRGPCPSSILPVRIVMEPSSPT